MPKHKLQHGAASNSSNARRVRLAESRGIDIPATSNSDQIETGDDHRNVTRRDTRITASSSESSSINIDVAREIDLELQRLRAELNEQKHQNDRQYNEFNALREIFQSNAFPHISPVLTFQQLMHEQKLIKFNGRANEDFIIWFADFQIAVNHSHLSESDKVDKFKTYLGGEARYVFEGFATDQVDTLEKAGERMRRVFAIARDSQEWILQLDQLKQSSTESIRVFGYRTNRIVRHAFPTADVNTINLLSIDYFLRGLPEETGKRVRLSKPATLESAIEKAEIRQGTINMQVNKNSGKKEGFGNLNAIKVQEDEQVKHVLEPYKNDINNRYNQMKEKINTIESTLKNFTKGTESGEFSDKLNSITERQKKWEERTNQGQQKAKYNRDDKPNPFRTSIQNRSSNYGDIECYHCHKRGHSYNQCYHATSEDKKRISEGKYNLNEKGKFSNSPRTQKP